ncbi:hypothetical protein ABPG75_003818 [Micractinium tetrahymenae]
MSEQGKAPGPRVGAGAPAPRPTAPPPGPVATTKTKRRSGPKSKSSPFIGVTQYKRTGNWEAHIWQGSPKAKGFQRHLGSYETAEEAARCYDRAALKLRGDAAELNYSRAEYEQDEFLVEHAKTDKFRFLDALRARFSIQTPARPAAPAPAPRPRPHRTTQQRGRRQESEDEDWDVRQPDSPRYRTVHRVPRPLAAPALAAPPPGPQRVTVVPQLPPSLRLDPLLPMPGPGRPGSGSMGMGMGSMGGLPSPGDQSPLGGSAAGRAKGLLLRQPSTGPAVSEELLITTAPLGSAGMHVHETLVWPFAQAAQPGLSQPAGVGGGADVGSGGPTPCSSPGLRLVPPIFELSPLQQAQQVQQAHQAQQTQQVQHGGCTSSGCTSSDGTLPAAPPGSPRSMGVSPGGYLGAGIGLCRSGGGGGGDDGRSAGDVLFKVPRIPASELSYKRFCLEFMEPNRPVIIQGATEGWAAAHDWVAPDGGVNLAFLRAHFGASLVSVTDTAREHEGCGPCHQMQLADYLDWWEQRQQQEQQQQQPPCAGIEALQLKPSAATPAERAAAVLACSTAAQPAGRVDSAEQAAAAATALPAGGLWYCKDWHLASECPQYQAYTCPAVFADDWLNEWYDADHSKGQQQAGSQAEQHQYEQQEQVAQQRQQGQQQQGQQQQTVTTADYRFVYLGPQGTSTPLHSDVLRSHSWSANVAGRKRWCLLPPRHSHLLLDRRGRDTAWDFDAADPEGQYPGLPKAQQHVLTVVQQPGEALFVPAGWFHTVENLDDCISINHNWVNGHSLHWTWALLRRERAAAEQGIDDCRQLCSPAEFEGLVQRNLGANAGLDYAGLGAMLRCTAGVSLHQLGCAAPAAADGSSGCRRQQQQQEQQQQQQQQQQQHGLAVAAGPTAAALQAAVDSPAIQQQLQEMGIAL